MNITQTFYDSLASQYEKLFFDWQAAVREQAVLLDKLFSENGLDRSRSVLDCACGIGTQAIGLAALGYAVTGSDISGCELEEAKRRAAEASAPIRLEHADFRVLDAVFSERFDIVICMDNALPHMLSKQDLAQAIASILGRVAEGGIFVGSIRDYDAMLRNKPPYSPPYIHKTDRGRRVSFQTWDWEGEHYKFTQYIIDDEDALQVSKFDCEYRAVCRAELTELLLWHGAGSVEWKFPEETGFYQPIVIARRAENR